MKAQRELSSVGSVRPRNRRGARLGFEMCARWLRSFPQCVYRYFTNGSDRRVYAEKQLRSAPSLTSRGSFCGYYSYIYYRTILTRPARVTTLVIQETSEFMVFSIRISLMFYQIPQYIYISYIDRHLCIVDTFTYTQKY